MSKLPTKYHYFQASNRDVLTGQAGNFDVFIVGDAFNSSPTDGDSIVGYGSGYERGRTRGGRRTKTFLRDVIDIPGEWGTGGRGAALSPLYTDEGLIPDPNRAREASINGAVLIRSPALEALYKNIGGLTNYAYYLIVNTGSPDILTGEDIMISVYTNELAVNIF